jgi:hypothetical protein
MQGISWLAEDLLASNEGPCTMESVSVKYTRLAHSFPVYDSSVLSGIKPTQTAQENYAYMNNKQLFFVKFKKN